MRHYRWVSQDTWDNIMTGDLIGGIFGLIILAVVAVFLFTVFVYVLPIVIFIIVCIALAKHCTNPLIGFVVIVAMLCGGAFYYHKALQIEGGNTQTEQVSSDKSGVNHTLNQMWNDVESEATTGSNNGIDLSSYFTNGTTNGDWQQENNWANDQRSSNKYQNIRIEPTNISTKVSGNNAHTKYDVNCTFIPNDSGKTIQKSYAWRAYLQRMNGKWIISYNVPNNNDFVKYQNQND